MYDKIPSPVNNTLVLNPGADTTQGTFTITMSSGRLNGFSDSGSYTATDCCGGQQVTITNSNLLKNGVKLLQANINAIKTVSYLTDFTSIRYNAPLPYEGVAGAFTIA